MDLAKPPPTFKCNGDCITGKWVYGAWDTCSVTCGGGTRKRTAKCVGKNGQEFSRQQCRTLALPTKEQCNTQHCPRWSVGQWRSCSATCGRGFKTRPVLCKNGNSVVPSHHCTSEMPQRMLSCSESIPCPHWSYTPWSFCSKSCGSGFQYRKGLCNGIGLCNMADQEPLRRECPDIDACEEVKNYKWSYGKWSVCSVTCGTNGVRMRPVYCHEESSSGIVDEQQCRHLTKPEILIVSCQASLTCFNGLWITGLWSTCTTTCGDGYKRRAIGCRLDGQYQSTEETCDPATRPTDTISCSSKSCPIEILEQYKWKSIGWEECSATCGYSTRKRSFVCTNQKEAVVSDDKCKQSPPIESQVCKTKPCKRYIWAKGSWRACSSTCGLGTQSRRVLCYRINLDSKKQVSTKNCKRHTRMKKPVKTRRCRASNYCVKWKTSIWSPCDKWCRQRRLLTCRERHTKIKLPDDRCVHMKRPKTKRGCKDCGGGRWKYGSWSQCSASCHSASHTPVQTRKVECVNKDQEVMHTNACRSNMEAERKRECPLVRCETPWDVGHWGPCSKTCGEGYVVRTVSCPTFGNCTTPKPPATSVCNIGSCTAQNCKDIQRIKETNKNGNYKLQESLNCLRDIQLEITYKMSITDTA